MWSSVARRGKDGAERGEWVSTCESNGSRAARTFDRARRPPSRARPPRSDAEKTHRGKSSPPRVRSDGRGGDRIRVRGRTPWRRTSCTCFRCARSVAGIALTSRRVAARNAGAPAAVPPAARFRARVPRCEGGRRARAQISHPSTDFVAEGTRVHQTTDPSSTRSRALSRFDLHSRLAVRFTARDGPRASLGTPPPASSSSTATTGTPPRPRGSRRPPPPPSPR